MVGILWTYPALEEVAPLRASQRGFWRILKGDGGPAEPCGGGGVGMVLGWFWDGVGVFLG